MIRNGRCGWPAGTADGPVGAPSVRSAMRPVPAASASSTTATMATHSRPCSANVTRISTGAAITRMSASHRSTPRWARNQYPPASNAHTPIAASPAMARLRHPATASTSTTAASTSPNAARASQRRSFIVMPPGSLSRATMSSPGRG